MKNVERLSMPLNLKRNAAGWKRELLSKIKECGRSGKKVADSFFDHYRQDDVRSKLEEMYNGHCCYCESDVGVVEYGNIEHRKPKRKFPSSCFDWNNLHLSCTRCNTKKGRHYVKRYPILDAVKDDITKHMTYKISPYGLLCDSRTKRAETTVKHTGLNEPKRKLPKKRLDVFLAALDLIVEINSMPDNPRNDVVINELDEMCNGSYGSVVDFARKKFLKVAC